MRPYEERKAARIERLHTRADAKRAEGEATLARAHQMADLIPFGQPILVGHHSEKRDRRYRERISSGFERGVAALNSADELARRAESAESNDAISSDDPEAIAKLRQQIADIEAHKVRSVAINRAIRAVWRSAEKQDLSAEERLAAGVAALGALGVGPKTANVVLQPDPFGRVGIPGYRLSSAGATIRRLKDRIALIEASAKATGRETTVGDVRIAWEDNRVKVFFPGKPDEAMRRNLKGRGFRWAPSEGAWQRHANEDAWAIAVRLVTPSAPVLESTRQGDTP